MKNNSDWNYVGVSLSIEIANNGYIITLGDLKKIICKDFLDLSNEIAKLSGLLEIGEKIVEMKCEE